MIIFVERKGN